MISAWVNGEAITQISITDRGLLYGDGFFTTAAIQNGKVFLLAEHLERLLLAAERLFVNIDINIIEKQLQQFLQTNQKAIKAFPRLVLKILVTRAESERGYAWGENKQANIILQLFEFSNFEGLKQKRDKGIRLAVCKNRLGTNPLLAGIKHTSRIENVLAASEFDKQQFDEGLMLDYQDNVIEACSSNIFILRNNSLLTPKLNQNGVNGLIRQKVLKRFSSDVFQIKECQLNLEDVIQADAIFLSNTVLGFCRVASIQDSDWKAEIEVERKVEEDVMFSANLLHSVFF